MEVMEILELKGRGEVQGQEGYLENREYQEWQDCREKQEWEVQLEPLESTECLGGMEQMENREMWYVDSENEKKI